MLSEQEKEPPKRRRVLCEAEALLRAEQESERRTSEQHPKPPNNPVRIVLD
jgi:hypothetical protein